MKKGFLLTLVVGAMLGMVVPAGALAPVIDDIPAIVIGDAEDSAGGLNLMRYLDVAPLAGLIETRNGAGTTNLSVYYAMTGTPENQCSTDLNIVAGLTALEETLLQAGTEPGAAKDLFLLANWSAATVPMLSFVNTRIHVGGKNAYDLALPGDGVPTPYPAGYNTADTCTLYAHESGVAAWKSFTVTATTGASDAWGAPAASYSADFTAGDGGWVNNTPAASTTYNAVAGVYVAATGWTFNATTGHTVPNFGEVQSGIAGVLAPVINADAVTVGPSKILHMTATLVSPAANAAACPGWRIFYAADLFTHMGGVIAFTNAGDGAGINAPYTGNDLSVELVWAVPYELTQYADGEVLSNFSSYLASVSDARDYKVLWSMVDWEDADAGAITLQDITVEVLSKPAGKPADVLWGSGGTAFNDGTNGWVDTPTVIAGFDAGQTWLETDFLEIGPGNGLTGYRQAAANVLGSTSWVRWDASELNRYTIDLVSPAAVETVGMYRIVSIIYEGTLGARSLIWLEQFGGDIGPKYWMEWAGHAAVVPPGVPKGSGSTIDTYIWTHGGDGGTASRLYPNVDIYNAGLFPGYVLNAVVGMYWPQMSWNDTNQPQNLRNNIIWMGNGYPNSVGHIRITRFSIEKDIGDGLGI